MDIIRKITGGWKKKRGSGQAATPTAAAGTLGPLDSGNASQISLHMVDGDDVADGHEHHNHQGRRNSSDSTEVGLPSTLRGFGIWPFVTSSSSSSSSSKKLILNATLKMATIFVLSCVLLGGILWIALPTLEEEDRSKLRVPKSFVQLKELNTLLKKYRDIYPVRIVICFVTAYLFLQAFSLPGSMYLSILGGAVWGVPFALPLVCVCVATGASLCYAISAALGPALLTLPRFKSKLDTWAEKIQANKGNVMSFLIVLRIAPLPPHWVVNVICPHVGVDIIRFWISTALGILGVSVIHTTIGGGLDEMTSPADFKLLSWKNLLGLGAIAVGVMIPVGLRWWFKPSVREIALPGEEEALHVMHVPNVEDDGEEDSERRSSIESRWRDDGPHPLLAGTRQQQGHHEEELSDDDDDIVLEGGPSMGLVNGPGSEHPPIILS